MDELKTTKKTPSWLPLLCHFNLCALFYSCLWIQTEFTLWKWSILVKINLALNRRFFGPCDLEILCMTFKNSRAPLLCHFKLCTLFRSHLWIQTGLTVQKSSIRVNIDIFCPMWPWQLMDDIEKPIGHLFYATARISHHFLAMCKFELELWSGKAQNGAKFVLASVTLTFDLWPCHFVCTSLLSMVITPDDFMMIWWQKHCEKFVKDKWMDTWTKTFLELLGCS